MRGRLLGEIGEGRRTDLGTSNLDAVEGGIDRVVRVRLGDALEFRHSDEYNLARKVSHSGIGGRGGEQCGIAEGPHGAGWTTEVQVPAVRCRVERNESREPLSDRVVEFMGLKLRPQPLCYGGAGAKRRV